MGNNLRRLRRAADLSQEQLAERSGVSQSAISRIERGQPAFVDDARRLAKALSVTIEDLFPDDSTKTPAPQGEPADERAA